LNAPRPQLPTNGAIDLFAQDVGMAGVPANLLDKIR
jgi:hypothetical protein